MSVGLGLLAHSDYGDERPAELGAYLRRWATTVEASGLDGVYTATEIGWDRSHPLALLAALAAWTTHVTVGTSVALAPLHDPLQLAEAMATIQQISAGRAVLGLGLGWREAEFDAVGVPLSQRRSRLLDHLDVLSDLFSGEEVTHRGRHHRFDGVRVGWASSGPPTPIWLGGTARAAIIRAGEQADGWIAGPFATFDVIQRQADIYREAVSSAGRGARGRVVVMRECWVAEDEATAYDEAEAIRHKYAEYARRAGRMPFDASWDLSRLAHDRFIIGDPQTCAEVLADLTRRTGATDLILRAQFRGVDPERALATVDLLGREVRPRLHQMLQDAGD